MPCAQANAKSHSMQQQWAAGGQGSGGGAAGGGAAAGAAVQDAAQGGTANGGLGLGGAGTGGAGGSVASADSSSAARSANGGTRPAVACLFHISKARTAGTLVVMQRAFKHALLAP